MNSRILKRANDRVHSSFGLSTLNSVRPSPFSAIGASWRSLSCSAGLGFQSKYPGIRFSLSGVNQDSRGVNSRPPCGQASESGLELSNAKQKWVPHISPSRCGPSQRHTPRPGYPLNPPKAHPQTRKTPPTAQHPTPIALHPTRIALCSSAIALCRTPIANRPSSMATSLTTTPPHAHSSASQTSACRELPSTPAQ